jgi:hypothetical protein
MSEVMDLYALIAAEFNIYIPETAPVFHIQYLAAKAEKKRNEKIKAAQEGRVFIG